MKTAIVWLLIQVTNPVTTIATLPSYSACESLKNRIEDSYYIVRNLECYQSEIVINQDLASPGVK